jgi:diguanylate cyclase (GGDEF)-like protein/PAS domain S-box-containing protein
MAFIRNLGQFFSGRSTLPELGDVDANRMARLLWQIVWMLLAVTVALLLLVFVNSKYQIANVILMIVGLGLEALVLALLHRGLVKLAIHFLLAMNWLAVSILILYSGGLTSMHIMGLVLLIILAVWMTNTRFAMVYLFLSIITVLISLYIERSSGPLTNLFGRSAIWPWGNIIAYLVLILLILLTLHRFYEESLNSAQVLESRYRNLVESISDSVLVVNFQLGVVNANARMAEMLGYSQFALMSRTYQDLLPENELPFIEAMRDKLMAGDSSSMVETRMIRFDGELVDVEISSGIVTDEAGTPVMIQSMIREISDRKRLEAELKRSMADLEKLARTDMLTGILNRRSLSELGDQLVEHANGDLCVVLIDLDRLKTINDNFGHYGGDQALLLIGNALKALAREGDHIGRWAGDEFMMLLENTSLETGLERAEALRKKIEDDPIHLPQGDMQVMISIGVVCSGQIEPNDEGLTPLVRCADRALYGAKQTGRNRVLAYSHELEHL